MSENHGVKDLGEINENDACRYGHKAVNLGLLMKAGFNVPNGIVFSHDFLSSIISNAHSRCTVIHHRAGERRPNGSWPGVSSGYEVYFRVNNHNVIITRILLYIGLITLIIVGANFILAWQKDFLEWILNLPKWILNLPKS